MSLSPTGGSSAALDAAIALHQRNALAEAARAYQAILAEDPTQADALHLLGVIAHQRGDSAQAVGLITRAIGVCPSVAAYHANLAEVYRVLGQTDRAIGCCRTALRLNPQFAEAANNLGLILFHQGQTEAARTHFETALRLQPNYPLACNNLANCWRVLGDLPRAIELFRRALTMDPQLAVAHTNLGQLLMERGDREAALFHCREAVRLQPNAAEAHNNLGNALRAAGRLVEARASYAEALSLNPELALTHCNMGQALQEEGKLDEAILWYRQAVELDPISARALVYLAGALEDLEDFAQAAVHYEQAVRLEPDNAEAHNFLGGARHELGHFPSALEHYRTALRLQPDFPAAQCSLGYALEELGQFAEAEQVFREVIGHNPHNARAHVQLACMLRGRLPEADLQVLAGLLADVNLKDHDRTSVHFTLAYVLDGRGDCALAAEHLQEANATALAQAQRRGRKYEPEEHARFVRAVQAAFTPAFFQHTAGWGLDTQRPVFIVGLPRSGTTLTEQVLASHSQVFGAGELRLARDDFLALAGALPADTEVFEPLYRLDPESVRRQAGRHLEELQVLDAAADRMVDKMPDNYLYLGLLAVLFPRARFIHCRRDLRDVAASCWLTQFRHIRWANDFDHIATRFEEYERLMAHWRHVLPVRLLEVDYEDTVADLEGTARRLLAFCGLDFEPACLAFHEGQRPIRTASITQVRQPLYRRSVGRWQRYEQALGPLFARLSTIETDFHRPPRPAAVPA
jgi:tetratricopeptide (TPR) repeat protein